MKPQIRPNTEVGMANEIYQLACELFPICRSITGDGVRQTLRILQREVPELIVHEVPSGTKCFDWKVPKEWNVKEAYVADPQGNKIIDFKENNLHLVGYSIPIDRSMSLEELDSHLYSIPTMPDAIPYVTSYYREDWGFCLRHDARVRLKPGNYKVRIDSELKDGHLSYGEVYLRGESEKEVFLSTYICHPSMGNNELSGPCVTAYLLKWLSSLSSPRLSYRAIFIPETIGSILYLSRNKDLLRSRTIAGFNITCVGDDRVYSFLPSRMGDTYADKVAQHVLQHKAPEFKSYSYLDRGSDERQYCSPGIDLPVVSMMRSKYNTYSEYHTSKDNLELISPNGLYGGYAMIKQAIEVIESDCTLRTLVFCEPQLGRRGLYPQISQSKLSHFQRTIRNLLAYSDGTKSLLEVATLIATPAWELVPLVERLKALDLIAAEPLTF